MENNYILSIYTYVFDKDNKYYVYNSESNFLSEISLTFSEVLRSGSWNKLPQEVIEMLVTNKIIVAPKDRYKFFYTSLMRQNLTNYDSEVLTLVIAPTTACNFACPYCFEENKQTYVMDDVVINAIYDYVKKQEKVKSINLTWYGGEPTLALSKIEEILEGLSGEGMPKLGFHSIITNGYLFDERALDVFKKYPLNHIQITIDGLAESHNKTRPLKGSNCGTFDRIVENVEAAAAAMPDTIVSIRVNINKNNYQNFFDLFEYFKPITAKYKNISLYPGFIREEECDGMSLCGSSYNSMEFNDFYEMLNDYGIDRSTFPSRTGKGCMAHSVYSYIIGPRGELYKCWNDVGNREREVGNIVSDSLEGSDILFNYMFGTLPFSEECKECSVFPICDGGCSFHRYKNKFEGANFILCTPYVDKDRLKKSLLSRVASEKSK